MRFRNHESIVYRLGGKSDLFALCTAAFFLRYLGRQQARIYIPNDGYKTVKLSDIQHREQVTS
jgi:hypothetical protein